MLDAFAIDFANMKELALVDDDHQDVERAVAETEQLEQGIGFEANRLKDEEGAFSTLCDVRKLLTELSASELFEMGVEYDVATHPMVKEPVELVVVSTQRLVVNQPLAEVVDE